MEQNLNNAKKYAEKFITDFGKKVDEAGGKKKELMVEELIKENWALKMETLELNMNHSREYNNLLSKLEMLIFEARGVNANVNKGEYYFIDYHRSIKFANSYEGNYKKYYSTFPELKREIEFLGKDISRSSVKGKGHIGIVETPNDIMVVFVGKEKDGGTFCSILGFSNCDALLSEYTQLQTIMSKEEFETFMPILIRSIREQRKDACFKSKN